MSKLRYRIPEVLCVTALIAFIVLLIFSRSGGSEKPVDEIAAPVIKAMDEGQMTRQPKADAAGAFSIDLSQAEGLVYYANDDIMDVSECLILKLKDESDAESVQASIEAHIASQKNLYKNYAPEQYALLNDSLLEVSGNMIFYCTAKNADALYDAFRAAL